MPRLAASTRAAAGDNTATSTNEVEGTLEICKDANGPTTTFDFVVDGSIDVSVPSNKCSLPMTVPAGPNTVQELSTANFHLVGWHVRPSSDYISGSGTATATVNVTPPGGTANGTLVTFTNAVNTGQFKICKTNTGDFDGLLDNDSFHFYRSRTVNGTTSSGSVNLEPGRSTDYGAAIPVLQNNGSAVTVTVRGDFRERG